MIILCAKRLGLRRRLGRPRPASPSGRRRRAPRRQGARARAWSSSGLEAALSRPHQDLAWGLARLAKTMRATSWMFRRAAAAVRAHARRPARSPRARRRGGLRQARLGGDRGEPRRAHRHAVRRGARTCACCAGSPRSTARAPARSRCSSSPAWSSPTSCLTGGIALGDDVIQQLVGHGLTAKLSARLGEGLVRRRARHRQLGLAASDVCRPLPYIEVQRPRFRQLVAEVAGSSLARRQSRVARPPQAQWIMGIMGLRPPRAAARPHVGLATL